MMDEKSLHSDASPTQHRNLTSLRWINLWRLMKLKNGEWGAKGHFSYERRPKHPE